MYCLSLDYKTAHSKVRSRFSLTKREILDLSNQVGSLVALFTCNRSEIYFLCEPPLMLNALDIPYDVKRLLFLYEKDEAVKHLFSVTCGLESMLKGEDDIARQMKKAYSFSLENKISNKELNIAFQKAFNCSKRVKSETLLSKSATSFRQNMQRNFIKIMTAKVKFFLWVQRVNSARLLRKILHRLICRWSSRKEPAAVQSAQTTIRSLLKKDMIILKMPIL